VAVEGASATSSRRIHEAVEALTRHVVETLSRRADPARAIHIEDIQDQVELALMRSGEHKVARAYVLYREERAQERRRREEQSAPAIQSKLHVRLKDGRLEPLDEMRLEHEIAAACLGLSGVSPEAVMTEVRRNLYDGLLLHELGLAQTMAARALVEQEPNYAYVSARLLLNNLRDEALAFVLLGSVGSTQKHSDLRYEEYFPEFVRRAIDLEILDKELGSFDLRRLAAALKPERDGNFQFLGLQTLYDRYFLHKGGVRFELPQAFFMRVAMGLAMRRSTVTPEQSSSTSFSPPSILCARRQRRSTPARCVPSFRPASSQPSPMIWTASSRPSKITRCSPSMRAGSATIGAAFADWVRTSEEQMVNRKVLFHF
jgi:ribonucleoside-diphosphate reductase alpha chain